MLAFINKHTAIFNLTILIPFIYILHILPFHILTTSKKSLYPDTSTEKVNTISKCLIIPNLFISLQNILDKFCFMSPISPQGMLIFGALTSSYRLLYS